MTRQRLALIKALVFIGCGLPFALLVVEAFGLFGRSLGPNPVETVLLTLGNTGLNILFLTLAVTPVRRLTGQNWLVRLRRMLGLFSFFYVALHFMTYAALDLRLDWATLEVDFTERPYIIVGMAALLGLIPLAVTSTQKMQRRLGRSWVRLHRLIYPIAILALVHFWWQVKADLTEPLIYATILAVLLGFRVAHWNSVRRARARARAGDSKPREPAVSRP
jgi:methionine sulfoxide reductase heme-binding subunit